MERRIYERTAAAEDAHWWFRGRRRIVESTIRRLKLPSDATILEAGCGSGGNLAMLARHGTVYGFEYDQAQVDIARARAVGQVARGSLPDEIPFGGVQFDLIVLLDVLEHLENDRECLRALLARLKPGGRVLVTVPALQWLWGPHDVVHHHHRRYSETRLRSVLVSVGLTPSICSYFNALLFPAVAARRLLERKGSAHTESDLAVPPAPVNKLLETVFASERFALPKVSLPIGSSLIAVASYAAAAVPVDG